MKENTLLAHSLKWGSIIGGINVIISLLIYLMDVSLFASIKLSVVLFIINISLVVYAGLAYRKSLGGFADFKTLLFALFLIQAVCGGIGVMFQVLLYNVLDPTVPEQITEASMETTENMLNFFNLPQDDIDEALEDAESDINDSLTTVGSIKAYFLPGFIIYLIIALIIAAIIKKNKPLFEEE